MAGSGRAEERLENIESVEPILSALRSVSQAGMQAARRRAEGAERYGRDLLALAGWLPEPDRKRADEEEGEVRPGTLLIALGSDRGLCGPFNQHVVEALADQLADVKEEGRSAEIWALGLRLRYPLAELGIRPERGERFTEGSVPNFERAYQLAEGIQAGVRQGWYDRVLLILNRQLRADRTRTGVEQLLPLELEEEGMVRDSWPPPILETDPAGLRDRIRRQALEVNLYRYLLRSSAAEHAARFYLLEDAAQNMDRLTEELEMEVQLARQQAITTEMMDLIAAAGLIKS